MSELESQPAVRALLERDGRYLLLLAAAGGRRSGCWRRSRRCRLCLRGAVSIEVVVGIVQRADLGVDKIVTPEAMGIHISTAVSLFADLPLVVVRKRGYGLPGEVRLHQETGYDESEMYLNDVAPGDRVLVIDDLLSTGNTLHAITQALEEVGATVAT